jgi:hypothetical protein
VLQRDSSGKEIVRNVPARKVRLKLTPAQRQKLKAKAKEKKEEAEAPKARLKDQLQAFPREQGESRQAWKTRAMKGFRAMQKAGKTPAGKGPRKAPYNVFGYSKTPEQPNNWEETGWDKRPPAGKSKKGKGKGKGKAQGKTGKAKNSASSKWDQKDSWKSSSDRWRNDSWNKDQWKKDSWDKDNWKKDSWAKDSWKTSWKKW